MFYSNNDSYMQDLYYYNQIPNSTFMNGCGNSMMGNSNMQPIIQGGVTNNPNNQIFMNPGMFSNNMQVQNLNTLYPSIYRILNPVVSRIVLSNNQPITDELLNNMTDTVFNIVEGQIDLGDDQVQGNNRIDNQSVSANSSSSSSNNSSPNRVAETTRLNNQNTQTSNSKHNRNDSILRDLIKILIIKELLSRNGFQKGNAGNSWGVMPFGYTPYCNNLNF